MAGGKGLEAIPKVSYSEITCHKVLYLLEFASDKWSYFVIGKMDRGTVQNL